MNKKFRILVTGAAGYIGSVAAAILTERGHRVYAVDSLVRGFRSAAPPSVPLTIADVRDKKTMIDVLKKNRIDTVFHFAGFGCVAESMQFPDLYQTNNAKASKSFFEAVCAASLVKRVIFSSSCAVYGTPHVDFIDENTVPKPVNPYGESKLTAEKALRHAASKAGFGFAILRYFNVAGAFGRYGERHDPETHLIPNLLRVAEGLEKEIVIYGDDYSTPDGTAIRDYIHVIDLVEAHIAALNAGLCGEIYNVGYGRGYSVKEVLAIAEEVVGRKIPQRLTFRRPGDPPRLVARASKIRSVGWIPVHDRLQDIIASTYTFMKQYGYGKTSPCLESLK